MKIFGYWLFGIFFILSTILFFAPAGTIQTEYGEIVDVAEAGAMFMVSGFCAFVAFIGLMMGLFSGRSDTIYRPSFDYTPTEKELQYANDLGIRSIGGFWIYNSRRFTTLDSAVIYAEKKINSRINWDIWIPVGAFIIALLIFLKLLMGVEPNTVTINESPRLTRQEQYDAMQAKIKERQDQAINEALAEFDREVCRQFGC
jgi:hypothetical protein